MFKVSYGLTLLIAGFLALVFLAPASIAQNQVDRKDDTTTKGKDKKDDKTSKDKTDDKVADEGVKTSKTKPYGTLRGKVKKADDKMLTIEVPSRPKPIEKDFEIATDAKIRVPPEQEFDAKGKPIRFKPDPKDPDRKLGGVKGAMSDVHEGATVEIRLGRYGAKKDMKLIATTIIVLVDVKK